MSTAHYPGLRSPEHCSSQSQVSMKHKTGGLLSRPVGSSGYLGQFLGDFPKSKNRKDMHSATWSACAARANMHV